MQQHICIIGGSELQKPLVERANKRGFITHVYDINPYSPARDVAHYFHQISIYEPEKILQEAQKIRPISVLSIASETGNKTANYIAKKLNLCSNSNHTICLTTDKFEMKKTFFKHGVPTPKSHLLKDHTDICFEYPFMVKAADLTSGRGVQKVENEEQFKEAVKNSCNYSPTKKILIEEYFEGKQFSVETITFQGKHQIVGITEEYYSGEPYFVEVQHLMQARISPELYKKLIPIVNKTLDSLNIEFGASHIELRINDQQEVKIIEVASRMGGDCRYELIKLSIGVDYVDLLLDAMLGIAPEFKPQKNQKFALIKWICRNKDYEIYKEIKQKYPALIIKEQIQRHTEKFEAQDGYERKGYYLLQFKDQKLIPALLKR